MFKLKEKSFTGWLTTGDFQVRLKDGRYSTENKDIIKALKADDRFIQEEKELLKKEKPAN